MVKKLPTISETTLIISEADKYSLNAIPIAEMITPTTIVEVW